MFEIFECSVRLVQFKIHVAAIMVGLRCSATDADRLIIILCRLFKFAKVVVRETSIAPDQSVVGRQLDRSAAVLDGVVKLF